MKILVIDDSKVILSSVEKMLSEREYTSIKVENGLEAIKHLENEGDVDLILLDWNMPEMNGHDFLKTVKEKSLTNAPILMMTSENKLETITLSISLGASEYIMKPFTEEILFSKIDMVKDAA